MFKLKTISTQDLHKNLNSPNTQIIDLRSIDAYNGWCLQNEARGGHIPGARSLPVKWADYIDWIEIVRHKQIHPEQNLILYAYDQATIEKVAARFAKAGYQNILAYPHFLSEWVKNPELPLNKLARYQHLVPAEWVNSLIQTGKAPTYSNKRFVILHAHYRNPSDYDLGHIRGAIGVDTNTLESPETWNRRSPEELKTTLESLGIDKDTTVICYGRFSYPDNNNPFPGSSAGHLGSIRCAAILLYAGVEDVRILNGGLQSWKDAGFEITEEKTTPNPVHNFGINIPSHPEYFIDTPEAEEYTRSPHKNLVSIRSWAEYIGEVSGYNYIEKKRPNPRIGVWKLRK